MNPPRIKCSNPECNFEGIVVFSPVVGGRRIKGMPLQYIYCPFCGCPPQKIAPRNIYKLRWQKLKEAFKRELLFGHIRLMERVEDLIKAGKEWTT